MAARTELANSSVCSQQQQQATQLVRGQRAQHLHEDVRCELLPSLDVNVCICACLPAGRKAAQCTHENNEVCLQHIHSWHLYCCSLCA